MPESLVDAHTHHFNNKHRQILVLDAIKIPKIIPPTFYCIGLHPWRAQDFKPDLLESVLSQHLKNPHFVALGELGLDRFANKREKDKVKNWQQQLDCFKWQLHFAVKYNISRLVLHSVGAYSDIQGLIKASGYTGKILWHNFNANEQTLQQLLRLNSYFSVGNQIFKNNCKIVSTIKHIPLERLLLETDDQHTHSLEEIYIQAAKILSTSKIQLIHSTNQALDNFLT
jgi:TatD DNase family protein